MRKDDADKSVRAPLVDHADIPCYRLAHAASSS